MSCGQDAIAWPWPSDQELRSSHVLVEISTVRPRWTATCIRKPFLPMTLIQSTRSRPRSLVLHGPAENPENQHLNSTEQDCNRIASVGRLFGNRRRTEWRSVGAVACSDGAPRTRRGAGGSRRAGQAPPPRAGRHGRGGSGGYGISHRICGAAGRESARWVVAAACRSPDHAMVAAARTRGPQPRILHALLWVVPSWQRLLILLFLTRRSSLELLVLLLLFYILSSEVVGTSAPAPVRAGRVHAALDFSPFAQWADADGAMDEGATARRVTKATVARWWALLAWEEEPGGGALVVDGGGHSGGVWVGGCWCRVGRPLMRRWARGHQCHDAAGGVWVILARSGAPARCWQARARACHAGVAQVGNCHILGTITIRRICGPARVPSRPMIGDAPAPWSAFSTPGATCSTVTQSARFPPCETAHSQSSLPRVRLTTLSIEAAAGRPTPRGRRVARKRRASCQCRTFWRGPCGCPVDENIAAVAGGSRRSTTLQRAPNAAPRSGDEDSKGYRQTFSDSSCAAKVLPHWSCRRVGAEGGFGGGRQVQKWIDVDRRRHNSCCYKQYSEKRWLPVPLAYFPALGPG